MAASAWGSSAKLVIATVRSVARHDDVVLELEEELQAVADDGVIVSDEDSNPLRQAPAPG
jgi:hypothetical protein